MAPSADLGHQSKPGRSERARAFAILHGWALPPRWQQQAMTSIPNVVRSVGCPEQPGPRAFVDGQGMVCPHMGSPALEIWWRSGTGNIHRLPGSGSDTYLQRRLPLSRSLLGNWTQGPFAFVALTSLQNVDGIRVLWHHLTVQNQSDTPQPLQITGALRPYGLEEMGVLQDLAFHTSGLFLQGGRVILHDAAGQMDGIRLSHANLGDVHDIIEGTIPPEGGLSLRDLRERNHQVSCSLGLCTGATTTAVELQPGDTHHRWWALPQGSVAAGDWPFHLLQDTWSQRVRSQLWAEAEKTESDSPMDHAGHFLVGHFEDSAKGEADYPGLPLPPSNDLPVLGAASSLVGSGTLHWSILARWLMHQQSQGLIEYRNEDPLAATAAWLYSSVTHVQRHPVMTGPRSPFPSDHHWPKALRLGVLAAGLEMRQRSREGWRNFRHEARLHTGEELTALARLMVATRQLALLHDQVISREEGKALLRVHGELRQLLAHGVATTLEHSVHGWLTPGVGVPFGSASVFTLEAFADLSPEDCPCPHSALQATARALFRLAHSDSSGCLRDENKLPSPGRTFRLALILRDLGYPAEAQRLADRVQEGAHHPGGGEWPRTLGFHPNVAVSAEDAVVSASALLMDRGWGIPSRQPPNHQ